MKNHSKTVAFASFLAIAPLIGLPSYAGVSLQELAAERNYSLLTSGKISRQCRQDSEINFDSVNGTEFIVKLATGISNSVENVKCISRLCSLMEEKLNISANL